MKRFKQRYALGGVGEERTGGGVLKKTLRSPIFSVISV